MFVFPASELPATSSDMPSIFCPYYVFVDSNNSQEVYYLLYFIQVFKRFFSNNRELSFKYMASQVYKSRISSCCDCRADCVTAFLCVDLFSPVGLRFWRMGPSSAFCLWDSCSFTAVYKSWNLSNASSRTPGPCRSFHSCIETGAIGLKSICLCCKYCLFDQVRAIVSIKHGWEFNFPDNPSCKIYSFCLNHFTSPLFGFPAYMNDIWFPKVDFLCPNRISESDKSLGRSGNTTLYQHIISSDQPVVEKTAVGSYFCAIGSDLKYALVELGPLMVSRLTHLWDSPGNMSWMPWAKSTYLPQATLS